MYCAINLKAFLPYRIFANIKNATVTGNYHYWRAVNCY